MVKMNFVKNKIKAKLIKATATFMIVVSVAGTCVTPALAAQPTTTTTTTTTSTPQKVDNSDVINYLKDKDKKAKEGKEKEEKKEKINEVGSIAGDLAVDYSKIDFTSDEAPMEAFKVTLKAANEAFIKEIPYVGGLLSALCNGFLSDGEQEAKEDPNTKLLQEIGDKIDQLGETFKNCTQRILNQNDRQEAKEQLKEFEAVAVALKKQYDNKNTGFQAAIEGLEMDIPAYEAAETFFKQIYSVDEYGGSYYEAYIDFVNNILNNSILVKTHENIFKTFDDFNKIGSDYDETKYLYNAERAALTQNVDNIIKTGYSTLKFVMELELAKETNIMNVCDGRNYYLSRVQDTNSYEAAGITKEAVAAERSKLSNEITKHKAKIRSITGHINTIDGLKTQADTIINNMNASIEEGKEYVQEKTANAKNKIYVYTKTTKAMKFNVYGKEVTAYPSFKRGDTKVVYKDIYGNEYGYRDVKYDVVKNPIYGRNYTFVLNGAATPTLGFCDKVTARYGGTYGPCGGFTRGSFWIYLNCDDKHRGPNAYNYPDSDECANGYELSVSTLAEVRDYYLGDFVQTSTTGTMISSNASAISKSASLPSSVFSAIG